MPGRPVPGRDAPALRAMALGEIIDASIGLYRRNWQVLAGIVAVFVVPIEVVSQLLSRNGEAAAMAAVLLGVLLGPLMGGAVSKAAGDLYLGDEPDVGSALRFTLTRLGPLVGVTLLTFLAVGAGLVALVVPGIILLVRLYFGSIVVVLERLGATDSMRRSFELTRGHFWRLVGAALVVTLIVMVVAAVLQLPFLLLSAGGDNAVVVALGSALVQVIVTPFSAVAAVLLYVDLRVRKEGFDLQVLADHLRGPRDDVPGQGW